MTFFERVFGKFFPVYVDKLPHHQVMSFFDNDDRFIITGPARIDLPRGGHIVNAGCEIELPKSMQKSCRVVYGKSVDDLHYS